MVRLSSVCGLVCAWVSSITLAAVPGSVETWDTDLAGWQESTVDSTVVHAATGGNPDGHVVIRKELGGPFENIGVATSTSSDYLGDYAGVVGVSVDIEFRTDNVTDAWIRFRPDVVSNGWRYSLTNTFPTDVWTTYTAPLDPTWDDATALLNGWERDDPGVGSFADLFSAAGWAEVRFDSPQSSTLIGVDNFRLIPVPEPSSLLLLGAAALATTAYARLRSPRRG